MLSPRNLLARLRREDGFTMLLVVGTMAVVMVVVGVVLSDVNADFRPGRKDEDRKIAYAAAEAGVADYQARLEANPSYWSQCVDATNPAVGNVGTKNFVNLPGSSAQYAVELLPTNGFATCSTSDQASMINGAGEFRIRVTGRPRAGDTTQRQIIATFRPKGFLNYIYYTDYETLDPKLYPYVTDGAATSGSQGDFYTWAMNNCGTTRWPARGNLSWRGTVGGYTNQTIRCTEIQFAAGDKVSGPFHTNDQIMVCEQPSFGRNPGDAVEIAGGSPGWRNAGCSSSTRPKVNNLPGYSTATNQSVGTWTIASQRDFPPSNASLHDDATANHRFKGPTTIVLNGSSMTVTGTREDGTVLTGQTMAIPEGVVYVSDNGSCPGYQPLAPYNGSSSGAPRGNPACGDLFISGTYSQNVTFATGNDIVATNNLTRTSDAWMLGLIPDKFARVYHPVNRSGSSCSDGTGELGDVRIDAAILALTHSFTVDAYECGNKLGTLTVNGAIAQKYRGPVGTSGGSGGTGYLKDYQYDQRLALRSPPRFMNPVQPAWAIANRTEQIPVS